MATREQKTEILHCLFLVASADDEITSVENEEIRIIAKGMNLSHEEFIAERSAFSDKLSVMRKLG